MTQYQTTSRFGYCLNDQKPPVIDRSAKYVIVGDSKYCGRPIIARSDGQFYAGEKTWIVDKFTLTPC